MFGLLIHEHEYGSSKVTKKLYHKIFASEYEGFEAAKKLSTVEALKLNRSSAQCGEKIEKFVSVDAGYVVEGMEEFDAAVIFVDGKNGIYSEHDATIYPVVSYKIVQFADTQYCGGMVLTR